MADPAPAFRPSGYPTPPLSPRTRRRHLRESEESEGEMSLEQYMHSFEHYRSVSVTTPLPLPTKRQDLPSLDEKIRPLHPRIQAIMRDHNLNVNSIFRCARQSKPGYPGGDEPLDFFIIDLYPSNSNIPRLGPIKDGIVRLFRQREIDAHVEIICKRYCHKPTVYFIAPTDPLVVAYEKAKDILVKILNQTLNKKWRLLCPFNVGSSRNQAQPMVVVLVEPWTYANWSELRLQMMYQMMRHMNLNACDIEFVPGGLSFLNNGGISLPHQVSPNATPQMGCSIGIQGDHNAGTLGGFVTLTHGGIVRRGFITNYHVVRPSRSEENHQFLKDLDRSGSSPARPLSRVINIEFLPRIDRDTTLEDLEDRLKDMRKWQSQISAKIQERELNGETPRPALMERLADYDSAIEKILPQLAEVEKMPHVLGEVKFVSGKQFRGGQVQDWAFVQLSTELEKYFRPNVMYAVPENFSPSNLNSSSSDSPVLISENRIIRDFGGLEKGAYCVKNGRTTQVTAGICNGAKAYCKLTTSGENNIRYGLDGSPVDLALEESEQFAIVTEESKSPQSKLPFCCDGDSGSFILSVSGDVTGLLWGGTLYDSLDIGLASSMTDVLESIKEKVGDAVSINLPQ